MIKHIRIQTFRSLVDVSVDLDPLTVLIGRSGTGKSNFVDAIRFLRDVLTIRTIDRDPHGWDQLGRGYLTHGGGWNRLLHVDHVNEPIVFDLMFAISGLREDYRYFLICNPLQARLEEFLEVMG